MPRSPLCAALLLATAARAEPPCAPVPDLTWTVEVTSGRGIGDDLRRSWTYGTERTIDLDRDGTPDALVPVPGGRLPGATCPHEVRRELHLVRGECAVPVGVIEGEPVAAATTTHGLVDLRATIPPPDQSEGTVTIDYRFDGARYVEVARSVDRARCDIHPDDCRDPYFVRCAVRGHPTVVGPFDHERVSARLGELADAASAQCAQPRLPLERCEVLPTFSRDGSLSALEVRDCPRRRACVERVFRDLQTAPFYDEPAMPSVSFQLR